MAATRILALPDGGKFELALPAGASNVSGPGVLSSPGCSMGWISVGVGILAGAVVGGTMVWFITRRR
jgi:hypothetical protein